MKVQIFYELGISEINDPIDTLNLLSSNGLN